MTGTEQMGLDTLTLDTAVNLAEIETLGRAALPQNALEYYASGANDEHTHRANRADFARLRLRPRVLVDVSDVDTCTTALGVDLSSPTGIAPSAFHGLAHAEAERATTRAAAGLGSVMTLSTYSNTPTEAVAALAGGSAVVPALPLQRPRSLARWCNGPRPPEPAPWY